MDRLRRIIMVSAWASKYLRLTMISMLAGENTTIHQKLFMLKEFSKAPASRISTLNPLMSLGLVPLHPVWSALLVLGACFFLGGLPLTDWLVRLTSGKRLTQLGTGNIGVSAAFYHGGTWVGSLAVCLETAKGIAPVLLAQQLFPDAKNDPY
jgi:Glycerol-3-phosphate acyltransferase